MPVRRKTLIILAITIPAFVGILYVTSRALLFSRFTQIERATVEQDVDRSSAAIDADLAAMDALALDNASWDAAYQFMSHPDPHFMQRAFGQAPVGSFAEQHDDFMLYVTPAGAIVGDEDFSLPPGDYARLLTDIRPHLTVGSPMIQSSLYSRHLDGLLVLPEGPVLVAARPVLPSNGQGAPDGVLVVGRLFSEGEVRRLAAQTSLNLSVGVAHGSTLPADFSAALSHLPFAGSVYVRALDTSAIAGYTLLADLYGKPALVVKAEVPRQVYQEGRLSMLYFAAALFLSAIAFGGIVQLLLDKSVVSPLTALNATVEKLSAGVDDNSAKARAGRDEIAMLGNSVHHLIDVVQTAQRQRAEVEARHRIFMNNLPAIAAIKDESGRYIYFNEPMARTFHLNLENLERPLEPAWFSADVRALIHSHELEVLRLLRPMEFEEMVPTPDGSEHYWLALRFPLTGADGKTLVGMVAIDITARKRAEAELSLAHKEAEIACRTKAEFLASMSHEIRTPINGVIGMTDLALESGLNAEQREYLSIVKTSGRNLLSLFNDILDFTKMEAGSLEFEIIDFSFPAAVESIVRSLAPVARESKIEISSHLDSAAPEALRGDPTRLRQVVVNLLKFAMKVTQSGEIVISADTEMKTEEEVVLHFCIHTPAEKVSLPLFSSPTLASDAPEACSNQDVHERGVAGLGTAIASRLVELMGGHIWVATEPGHGSSLEFNARFDLPHSSADAVRPAPMSRLRGVRVIVADDNPSNRRILSDMLTGWQMRVTLAAGGEEALAELEHAYAQGAPFTIAILDGRMPDMDGFALAEKIRNNPDLADEAIVLMTSAGLRGDAARCRDLGVKAYLPKPVTPADLLETIRRILGQAAAENHALLTRHSLREARRYLKILVAEDNAVDRTLAVRLLEKRGYTVETAETGRAVLNLLENQPFDAILMDIQMPEMDGLQATTAIRERERVTGQHVPIIAMTAYAMSGDRERCLAAGMDSYIPKPLNVQHLYQTIDELSGTRLAPSVA